VSEARANGVDSSVWIYPSTSPIRSICPIASVFIFRFNLNRSRWLESGFVQFKFPLRPAELGTAYLRLFVPQLPIGHPHSSPYATLQANHPGLPSPCYSHSVTLIIKIATPSTADLRQFPEHVVLDKRSISVNKRFPRSGSVITDSHCAPRRRWPVPFGGIRMITSTDTPALQTQRHSVVCALPRASRA
jgi:hypothetical protein